MADEAKECIAASLRAELRFLRVVSPNRCIYRVTGNLRQVNEEAYRPSIVSIGPFYSQDPRLQAMQEQKLRHLEVFLQRGIKGYTLEYYISFVREREQEAREYYAEEISLSSNDFVKMLLLDAAFIIEFFLCFTVDGSDVVKHKMEVINQVDRDLYREENQVPFFILEGLYNLAFAGMNHIPFIHFTFAIVRSSFNLGIDETTLDKIITNKRSTIRHLADCLRICLMPSILRGQLPDDERKVQFPMAASELSAAGVKFVASESNHLLDVRFIVNKGVLEIPKFTVHDSTESRFRSIMMLEQCCHYFDSYFLDYVTFLDQLIDTSKDVEILVKNGIMKNYLGSNDEVADLFNNMIKNVSMNFGQFYYHSVSADLNEYATRSWNRWKAILKRNYFSHPWSTISVIYAVVLLLLTMLQTISSFTSKN